MAVTVVSYIFFAYTPYFQKADALKKAMLLGFIAGSSLSVERLKNFPKLGFITFFLFSYFIAVETNIV